MYLQRVFHQCLGPLLREIEQGKQKDDNGSLLSLLAGILAAVPAAVLASESAQLLPSLGALILESTADSRLLNTFSDLLVASATQQDKVPPREIILSPLLSVASNRRSAVP
jgi:hypothetical protein